MNSVNESSSEDQGGDCDESLAAEPKELALDTKKVCVRHRQSHLLRTVVSQQPKLTFCYSILTTGDKDET